MNIDAKKVIIFDFDGTIGTLLTDWNEWRRQFETLVLKFDKNTEVETVNIMYDAQNAFVKKYGAEFRDKLNQVCENIEDDFTTGFVVNEDVLSFINQTDKELYCWSSNSRKTLEKYFLELGILDKFKKVISRDETFLLKPENEGFDYIYDSKIPKEKYLFIGNSETDKGAAEKSGIEFLNIDSSDFPSTISTS